MEGYFTLILDTTGPVITAYSPQYSDRNHSNEIRFVSNETLANYQNIYIIDSQGVTHNVIFSFNGIDEYTGNVVFSNYPMGVASIYGQFKDDVGNLSNISITQVNIISTLDALVLKITMTEEEKVVSMNENIMVNALTEEEASVKITPTEKSVKLIEST